MFRMSTRFPTFLVLIALIITGTELACSCTSKCHLTWTLNDNSSSECSCGHGSLDGYDPSCLERLDKLRVTVSAEYCMTFDEEMNVTYYGKCPYNSLMLHYTESDGFNNVDLPPDALKLNNFVCNVSNFSRNTKFYRNVCGQQRRQGMLCSDCGKGLGPAVLSYTRPCVECKWYGFVLYLIMSFVPATLLCFLITVLRINVLSPPLNAIVFFCHVMAAYVNHVPCKFLYYASINMGLMSPLILVVMTLYGFFNMDFFMYVMPPFCISDKMSTMTVVALDYVVALYPLLLSAVIYLLIKVHDSGNCLPLVVIWWPFHKCLARFRRSLDIRGSIINAFATLYVLSFTKVVSTSVNLMLTVEVINMCGETLLSRLYYDASCKISDPCHYPYIFLNLAVSVTFICLPMLFIFLQPCKFFNRYRCLQCQLYNLAVEVAKIFQQSFKDGAGDTNTIDGRWFAAMYLLIRVIIAVSVNVRTTQQMQVISAFVGLMLVAIFQPHVRTCYNVLDSLLFMCLGVVFILAPSGQTHHFTQVYIFFLPLLTMIIFITWKVVTFKKFKINNCKTRSCLCYLQRLLPKKPTSSEEERPLIDNI